MPKPFIRLRPFITTAMLDMAASPPHRTPMLHIQETLWIDDFCISARLKQYPEKLQAAYMFIDYMLSDAMQMKVYEDQYYIPVTDPVLTQLSSISSDVRINKSFYKDHSHTLMQPMNVRTRNFYKLLWWREIKSGEKNYLMSSVSLPHELEIRFCSNFYTVDIFRCLRETCYLVSFAVEDLGKRFCVPSIRVFDFTPTLHKKM